MTPELIYDADCGFCTRSALFLSDHGRAFRMRSWQEVPELSQIGLTLEDVTSAAYWRCGSVIHRGAEAIGHALVARGGPFLLAGRLVLAPPLRPLARRVYAVVATNRHRLPGASAACRVEHRSASPLPVQVSQPRTATAAASPVPPSGPGRRVE